MARATWDDFATKHGFSDGSTSEERDFQARTKIVQKLNKTNAFKSAKVRAIEYDRPGVHNSCLIVLLLNLQNKSDDELSADWLDNKTEAVSLPSGVNVEDVIREVYDKF